MRLIGGDVDACEKSSIRGRSIRCAAERALAHEGGLGVAPRVPVEVEPQLVAGVRVMFRQAIVSEPVMVRVAGSSRASIE